MIADRVRGFYAVIDRDDLALARVLLAHAQVIQLRMKHATADEIVRVATKLRALCDELDRALVVNDRIDIALHVRADGVHLGQTDLPLAAARGIVEGRLAIGVSTHDLAQVRAAVSGGADYLGFGPVFATSTKVNPDPVVGIEGLRAAVEVAGAVPIVAIGGLTPANAGAAYAAGAAAVCAISAVTNATDVDAAAAAVSARSHSRS